MKLQLDLVIVAEFYVLVTVFWWQGFSDSVLGDLEIDDASVVDDYIAVVIVLYLWIQYENLWNMVPGRKEKVVAFCRSAPTY